MEKFYQGVVATLSFLLVVIFCMSDISHSEEKPQKISTPVVKNIKFEQVPAVVILEEDYEKKFDRTIEKGLR